MSSAQYETAVVVGAGGGIGQAVAQHLLNSGAAQSVWTVARGPVDGFGQTGHLQADITDDIAVAHMAAALPGSLDLVFVATGVLSHGASPERSYKALDGPTMADLFAINTIGPALLAKYLLPKLPRDKRAVFATLSARVGSIEDNRLGGWMSYRASKAALNQMIRCFAIELHRTHKQAICVGLHPGTVDTGLSQPFQRGVPAGKLFTPQASAEKLLAVLAGLTPADTGRQFAYDGAVIPP